MSVVGELRNRCRDALARARHPQLRRAFGVNSHMTLQERVQLYRLGIGARAIAEIGSYTGASACCFGAALRASGGGRVVCIDTWNNDAMTEGQRDTWQEFHDNTSDFGDLILPVRGFSTAVVDRVAGIAPRLDVLFIDGDHSYDGVKSDWEAYKGLLGPGSVVIFHDHGWAEGVQRVVREDVAPLVRAHDRLPNMWWGRMEAGR